MNKNSPQNPTSIKAKLASRFLRAMKKMKNDVSLSSSKADKCKRRNAIRSAAYASMASVVGPNKAWSRAVLRKIKNRRESSPRRHRRARNPRCRLGFGPEKDLRELVPGGGGLDLGRLLNESGDYIKCLKAQVEVMRTIVEYSSKFMKL